MLMCYGHSISSPSLTLPATLSIITIQMLISIKTSCGGPTYLTAYETLKYKTPDKIIT